jgi:hypothetical protein
MTRDGFVRLYRLVGAVLIVTAEVHIFSVRGTTTASWLANHFSYFTVLSNLIAVVVLLAGALRPASSPDSEGWELLRGAAVLYMAMTGLVYLLLLSGVDVNTPGFSNWVMHRIMPLVMVLDWVFVPPRVPLSLRRTLWWLAFPLLYLPYTLIRGEIVDWYPYPFLDPTRDGGYPRVAANCIGVGLGFIALTWLITWVGNHLGGHDTAPHPVPSPAQGLP